MLFVKTYLDKSHISGIGLFAGEDIPKGTLIWKFVPTFDSILTDAQYKKLLPLARDWLEEYCYYDKWKRVHVICVDEDRFFNHAENPNVDNTDKEITIAKRDIRKREELTCDYFEFDLYAHKKLKPSQKQREHLKQYGRLRHPAKKPLSRKRK